MAVKSTPVVFITGNVGSIFEEPTVMLKIWTQEFLSTIARLDPKFVALHCQEVGGKNYEKSMQHVENFVQLLVDSDELRLFDKVRIFLDEDYSSAESFTALGNFYFIHESVTDALLYDFQSKGFIQVSGKEIHRNNIELVPTKEKSKFPPQYFPLCKWSRKGFLRTRWSLNGVIFDLVNIHLFHDASNILAINSSPSTYTDTRYDALAYTLKRFRTDDYGSVPLFLFGDFNFRPDTQSVVKHLAKDSHICCSEDSDYANKVLEFKKDDKVILSIKEKVFNHSDHQALFSANGGSWLREFDKEINQFEKELFEFPISFPPSYPFEENPSGENCYMKTRCPAWCDRVILSHSAVPLVKDNTDPGSIEYGLMGRDVCMGDHKPVYLKVIMNGSTDKETCLQANQSRVLPKPNIQYINYGKQSKEGDETSSDKNDFDKSFRIPTSKYSEIGIEKLGCTVEAIISQNSTLPPESVENIEPDLSKCHTCRSHQHSRKMVGNAGGEQVINGELHVEDPKILGLLAYEIKVPDSALKKLEVNDTGQKSNTCETSVTNVEKIDSEKIENEADRFGVVKRVNSASLVENKPKKEDWKNSRCNSDVSWKPPTMVCNQPPDVAKIWGINKSFSRGNSRIRLISSSNSLNVSLPRLTSHHSSSDEEWFEQIEESDDDVLQVSCDEITDRRKMSQVSNDSWEGSREAVVTEFGDQPPPITESQSELPSLNDKARADESSVRDETPNTVQDGDDGGGMVNITYESQTEPQSTSSKTLPESVKSGGIVVKKSKSSLCPSSDTSDMGPKSYDKKISKKTFSILRRLTEGHKESNNGLLSNGRNFDNGERVKNLVFEPNCFTGGESELRHQTSSSLPICDKTTSYKIQDLPEKLIASVNPDNFADDSKIGTHFLKLDLITKGSIESWETIELGDKKNNESDVPINDFSNELHKNEKSNRKKCYRERQNNCCCTLQ